MPHGDGMGPNKLSPIAAHSAHYMWPLPAPHPRLFQISIYKGLLLKMLMAYYLPDSLSQ